MQPVYFTVEEILRFQKYFWIIQQMEHTTQNILKPLPTKINKQANFYPAMYYRFLNKSFLSGIKLRKGVGRIQLNGFWKEHFPFSEKFWFLTFT